MRIGNSIRLRAALILVLLLLHGGMFLDYGYKIEQCPNVECFAEEYDRYIGQRFLVGGDVVATNPPTIALQYAQGRALELQLQGFDAAVSRGARVVVYGRFEPGRTIQVQDYIVHHATNRRYMYGVSLAAILLVVILGLRDWQFDFDAFVFRRRGDG